MSADDNGDDDNFLSPLLEMTSLSVASQEESTEEDENRVPPISNCWNGFKYWCGQFKVSLLMLLLNIASIVACNLLCHIYVHNYNATSKTRICICCGFVLMTCLIDALVSLRFARYVEHLAASQNDEKPEADLEATSKDQQKNLDYIAVSNAIDRLFGCVPHDPKNTFLVGLMYAIFSLTVLGIVGSFNSFIYVLQEHKETYSYGDGFNYTVFSPSTCLSRPMHVSDHYKRDTFKKRTSFATLQNATGFERIPSDIQQWIKSKNQSFDGGGFYSYPQDDSESMLHHVETSDGAVAVAYGEQNSLKRDSGLLVFGVNDTKLQKFSNKIPNVLVGFPREPPYLGWCAVLGPQNKWDSDVLDETLYPPAMCYSVNTGNITEFKSIKVQKTSDNSTAKPKSRSRSYRKHNERHVDGSETRVFATNDTLWIATRTDFEGSLFPESRPQRESKQDIRLALTAFDVSNMERAFNVSITVNGTGYRNGYEYTAKAVLNSACNAWSKVLFWTALPLVLLMSALLYKKNVASALVPVSIVLPVFWTSTGALVLAGLFTLLLATKRYNHRNCSVHWKYVPSEMTVWSQYALLAGVSAICVVELSAVIGGDWYYLRRGLGNMLVIPCFTLLICVANALFMGHPVFELFGLLCAILSVVSIPYFALHHPILLLISFLLFSLALGCAGVGRLCRRYRFHAIVYGRRCWRFLHTTGSVGKHG